MSTPHRESPPEQEREAALSRREILGAASAVAAAGVLSGCGAEEMMMPMDTASQCKTIPTNPLVITDDGTLAVGQARRIEYGSETPKDAIYLHRNANGFIALDERCSHAGCALAMTGGLYKCGCHGSQFNLDGTVSKGPATLPLLTFPMCRRATDNALIVDPGTPTPNTGVRIK